MTLRQCQERFYIHFIQFLVLPGLRRVIGVSASGTNLQHDAAGTDRDACPWAGAVES